MIDTRIQIMTHVVIGSPVIYLLDQLLKRIFMKLLHHRGERQHHQVATAGGFLENALMNMFLIIWFGPNGDAVPSIKRFLSEVKQTIVPMTIWKYEDVGHSQSASQYLKRLFDDKAYFSYPKPVPLIKRIVELYSNPDSIVLDFFSGSATTAEAVMRMNVEDGGNR
ncbi:DNA methyltransferase [Enterococcus faecalis]|uniref:DNA methyltransferase n=3 Tax=Enterococcus TaxID=1350 RepID=UPI0035A32966